MITFDAEDDSHGNCFLMGFYDGVKYIPFERKNYKSDTAFRASIIDFILNSGESVFVAHNLEYDLSHIFQGEFLTGVDWYYSNQLIFAKVPKTRIKFIDSFHFSYTSLKELGKEINYPKKVIDIKNILKLYEKKPKKVLEYNSTDCEIVYAYMKQFEENIYSKFEMKIKNTLSGTAQGIFIKHFSNYELTGCNTDAELLEGYYGGRVECFHVGEVNTPVFEIDVNSMYPTVMINNPFPINREMVVSKTPETSLHLSKIRVNVKPCYLPVLPFRDKKLLFPCGTFETYATNVEIEKAIAENQINDIKYLKTYNFGDGDYVFKDFVAHFYTLRKKAKDSGDKFNSEFYKRILNHVYGRFALHKELRKLTAITEDNEKYIDEINDIAGYVTLALNDKSKNFALSIFVTSYARVYLYNMLKKVNENYDIIYCDTDSCYFTDLKGCDLQDSIEAIYKNFPINNALGNYSLAAYESGIFYNVKSYLLNKYDTEKKIKLKGVKKEYREEFLKTGKTKYLKPVKMRSSLRSVQGLKANSWELHCISRKGSYDKRNMIEYNRGLFKTEPKIIQEG